MCMHICLATISSNILIIPITFFPSLSFLPHYLLNLVLSSISPSITAPFPVFLLTPSLSLPYQPVPLQEDARADVVDCIVKDIQNTQCLLNVEYQGPTCPLVTIQFGDTKDDVGLGLVKEGLVMVDVRKEKHLQKMVSEVKS